MLKIPARIKDLTGQKFGFLVVLELSEQKLGTKYAWKCLCICGREKTVSSNHLCRGAVKSCGCKRVEIVKQYITKHGYCQRGKVTKEYKTWRHIKDRCLNPNDCSYHNYGGRGIKVCPEWEESFDNFLRDMGNAPSKSHSIERIDVNDDYHPSNCIWILKQEQARNTRKNKLNIEAVQQIKNMASHGIKQQDIAKKFNISQTMVSRILLGKSWSGI